MNPVTNFFKEERALIIAEVAQSHDGSLGQAHAFIDVAARAGADAIKFQTHIANEESTSLDEWRVKFSRQDKTRFDYWRRMEFTEEQWRGLKRHADETSLIFLSSPFSIAAVDLLERLDLPAWKIASGELTNTPMLERIAATRKPVLLSSGMSDLVELDERTSWLRQRGIEFAVMQCTTAYPTPPEQVGLNVMLEFRKRYGCPVGLSDHSGTIYPALAAAAHGMNVLELHITLSRDMFGPDVVASVTPDELKQLVEGVRFIENIMQHPVKKDDAAESLTPMRKLFTKSIVAASDLEVGTVISERHLAFKKPGAGMPASMYRQLLGRRLVHSVPYNHFFNEEDFA